jgi:hypothetical protein
MLVWNDFAGNVSNESTHPITIKIITIIVCCVGDHTHTKPYQVYVTRYISKQSNFEACRLASLRFKLTRFARIIHPFIAD